jgi:hypothetical protein
MAHLGLFWCLLPIVLLRVHLSDIMIPERVGSRYVLVTLLNAVN